MTQKKFNMVTSVVMTSLIIRALAQNYAKKCKNGTIWKIEIVRVGRRCNGKYTSLNKKIARSDQSWHTWKKFSKRAKFTNDRIVRLNHYKISTNHPFHLKFCTVAHYILTSKMAKFFFLNFALIYVMTLIMFSNLCQKFVKFQRGIICNPCVCPTGYEFKYFKSIV